MHARIGSFAIEARKNLETKTNTWYLRAIDTAGSSHGSGWFPSSAGFFLEMARGEVREPPATAGTRGDDDHSGSDG